MRKLSKKTSSYIDDEFLSEVIPSYRYTTTRETHTSCRIDYSYPENPVSICTTTQDTIGSSIYTITNHQDGQFLKTETIENSNYDNFGNIGTVVSTIVDETTDHTFKKTTTNSYTNHENAWILGRLTEATVTSEAPNTPAITKTSSFTYDHTTGILLSETIEPNDEKALTKTYTYNDHGNKKTETISASNITPRTTTTTYDPLGKFTIKVTNTLGQSETRTYNPEGQMLSLTGPNGGTMTPLVKRVKRYVW